jgi:hypothetical protein
MNRKETAHSIYHKLVAARAEVELAMTTIVMASAGVEGASVSVSEAVGSNINSAQFFLKDAKSLLPIPPVKIERKFDESASEIPPQIPG